MVSLHFKEMKFSSLVQRLETDPVLGVDGRLPQWKDDVRLARRVELKVGALPRLHHAVLVVLHHHEILKSGKVHSVRSCNSLVNNIKYSNNFMKYHSCQPSRC